MRKPLALALALALALPAAGADSAAGARAKAIAPFLDEQTLAVVRLDLTKLDADALATAMADLGGMGADEATHFKQTAGQWLGDFAKVGGKDLYVIASLADYPNWPFVIVPLGDGADATAIANPLGPRVAPAGPRERVGTVLFAGAAATHQRLKGLKPAERPELAAALAAAGDAAAQVALIPPPHLARVVEEMMLALPKEAGEGSGKVLTRGVKWAALGLDAPPKLAVRLTIQTQDAAAARAVRETIGKVLKWSAAIKEVRDVLPDVEKMVAALEPKVEGDYVILALEGERPRTVVGPLVRRALVAAARVQASNDLKQLALALHVYVDNHNGQMPAVASTDNAGRPLLSWRVHLLPYLGEEKLYKEFHLDESWDSEHNKKLIARMPAVFRGASRKLSDEGKTTYLAPVGNEVAFTGNATGRRFPTEFPDGTSNTILLVQADEAHAVEWTRPQDLKIDLDQPQAGLGLQAGSYVVALADGYVHVISPGVTKATLRAAFTANGGEVLGADWR
jgi:hypothetical protein